MPVNNIPMHDAFRARDVQSTREADVSCFLQKLHGSEAFELRARMKESAVQRMRCGYFDDVLMAMEDVERMDNSAEVEAIWTNLNPIRPDALSLIENKFSKSSGTKNDDIAKRSHLLIDFDPVRESEGMATEAEREAAKACCVAVREHLGTMGWPAPLFINMSGSGFHLIYRVDLSSDGDSTELVGAVLAVLDRRFSSDRVQIDPAVKNLGRMVEVPGTWARKGENTDDRPWRKAEVVEMDRNAGVVSKEMLQALTDQDSRGRRRASNARGRSSGEGPRSGALGGDLETANGVSKGDRNTTLARLAGRHIARGEEVEDVLEKAIAWDKQNEPPMGESEVERTVHSIWDTDQRNHGDEKREGGRLVIRNYVQEGDGRKRPRAVQDIAVDVLEACDGWPKLVGGQLVVEERGQMRPLASQNALFGFLHAYAGVDWASGTRMITKPEFHAAMGAHVEAYETMESTPHWPTVKGVYYSHRELPPSDGRYLRQFIDLFKPDTEIDRQLIEAMVLTVLWGGAPGKRPAFLITSKEDDAEQGRGVGKTTLAAAVARLAGGPISKRQGESMEQFMPRLLSDDAADKRVVLLDNIKAAKLSDSGIEEAITNPVLSGKRLYKGEGRRHNYFVWVLTVNAAGLSYDLAKRCLPIVLRRPENDPAWEEKLEALLSQHSREIIADGVAKLRDHMEQRTGSQTAYSRWSSWERGVLSAVGDAQACMTIVGERQAAVNRDIVEQDELAAELRAAFVYGSVLPDGRRFLKNGSSQN